LYLGLVPWGISLVIGHGPLHIFGVIFIAVASGDAIVLWLLRDVPADAWVQDHPDRVGGILVEDGAAPSADQPPES